MALLLSVVSSVLALRIEVRTGLQDVLDKDDPIVERLQRLAKNFPGALTVMVVVEGQDRARMIEVANALRDGFVEDETLVRAVYLEQPVEFFTEHALLYLTDDELRHAAALLEEHRVELKALLEDPSLLGLLRTLSTSDTVYTLSSRAFGRVNWDETLQGRPAARVGLRVDPKPQWDKLRKQRIEFMKGAPLPPSDPRADEILDIAIPLLDLVAQVLERGEAVDRARFHDEAERLSTRQNGALPSTYTFRAHLKTSPCRPSALFGPWLRCGFGHFPTGKSLTRASPGTKYRSNSSVRGFEMRSSKDGGLLLMEVSGARDLNLLEHIRPTLAHLRAVIARVQEKNRDVQVGLTGIPVMYDQEQSAILDNFALVTLLGLLGVLAVFIIGFERIGLPLLAMPPLLMGILWTIGVQAVVRPELNMLNLLFPVVLFGLGVDFAIHLIAGYTAARSGGGSAEEAIASSYAATGPGLVVGAVTTSVAFFALLVAQVQGVRDLGLTAGLGVLMTMLVVLPALIALKARREDRAEAVVADVSFQWLARVGQMCVKQRYLVLAGFLVATIAFAYFIPRVEFERDALKIQPEGMPASVLYARVLAALDISGAPTVFFAKDLDEARKITARAQAAKTLSAPLSITLAIPPRQKEKAPLIEEVAREIDALNRAEAPVEHTWDEAELEELQTRLAALKSTALELSVLASALYDQDTEDKVGELRDILNRIDRRVKTAPDIERLSRLDGMIQREVDDAFARFVAMADKRSLSAADLPAQLTERVRGTDGSWIVLVRANDYVYEEAFLRTHVAELKAISSEHAGLVPLWAEMLTQIQRDLPIMSLATLIAVAFIVLIGLRSIKGALLSLVPLVVGLVWTLGVLGLLGVKLNFISVLSVPLIVGIGIDDGVHLYHRIRHDRSVTRALVHAGKGLILTSMTTGIGFGSLLLSVHRGVYSLGLTTVIGIVACLVVSLLLLPALVAIFQGQLTEQDQRPSAEQEST